MNKRGQIAAFIILGVIVLSTFLFLFYSKYTSTEKKAEAGTKAIELDMNSIRFFVERCIGQVGYDAIYIMGRRGGSIVYNGDGLVTSYSIIDFLYDKGQNRVPSINEMEEQLSLYVKGTLNPCLGNLSVFKAYDFSYDELNVNTLIGKEEVSFKVNYPITTHVGDSTKVTSDFIVVLPVRLSHIREVANSIVESQIGEPGWVDMTLMGNFDVNVSVHPYNRTILVYEILDNQSLVYNEPYQFLFANRFEDE